MHPLSVVVADGAAILTEVDPEGAVPGALVTEMSDAAEEEAMRFA